MELKIKERKKNTKTKTLQERWLIKNTLKDERCLQAIDSV